MTTDHAWHVEKRTRLRPLEPPTNPRVLPNHHHVIYLAKEQVPIRRLAFPLRVPLSMITGVLALAELASGLALA